MTPGPLPAGSTLTATELVGRYLGTTWTAQDETAVIARVAAGIRTGWGPPGDGTTVKGPPDAGPKFTEGMTYRFHGRWERHPKYGHQFAFSTYSAVVPHDRRGVIAYLVSVADGVGEKRAGRLWDMFGGEAVRVLREEPARVALAGIMSDVAAREASESLRQESEFETVKIDLLALFTQRGLQAAKCIKLALRLWGARAAERIRHNPYLLLSKRFPGAGFKRCDRMYLDFGHNPGRLKRQALKAWDAIRSDSSGHTWVPAEQVAKALVEAIPAADVLRALRLAIRGRLLAIYREAPNGRGGVEKWLAEWRKAHNEAVVADQVRGMCA